MTLRLHGNKPRLVLGDCGDDTLQIDGYDKQLNIRQGDEYLLTVSNADDPSCPPSTMAPLNSPSGSCPAAAPAAPASGTCPVGGTTTTIALDTDKASKNVTYLSQADFEEGGYFITKPGKYVLTENIILDHSNPAKASAKYYEKQLLSTGQINPIFTGNSTSARGNIGIAICCSFVEIDGNGYSIEQSGYDAAQFRIATLIECSGTSAKVRSGTCPHGAGDIDSVADAKDQGCSKFFGNNNDSFGGGGPGEVNTFGEEEKTNFDVGNVGIHIHDLKFGRNSHFGIHGTNNRNLVIEDCDFFEFEVAAIWLNQPVAPIVERCNIVGMDKHWQTLSQLWAFRTQGTGLRGIVNASYWGIIYNQQFGGVGLVFPQPSGGLLSNTDGGLSASFQKDVLPGEFGLTAGGINKQRVGGRGGLMKDVNITELKSQMIVGHILARKARADSATSTMPSVPLLFTNKPSDVIGGGGHGGYTAKWSTAALAVIDGLAFYLHPICILYFQLLQAGHISDDASADAWIAKALHRTATTSSATDLALLKQTILDTVASTDADLVAYKTFASTMFTLKKADGTDLDISTVLAMDEVPTDIDLYHGAEKVPGQHTMTRLADRALIWKDSEGKAAYWPQHKGLVQWRGAGKAHTADAFVYNFSNVYSAAGSVLCGAPMASFTPAEGMDVKLAYAAKCHSASADSGRAWFHEASASAEGYYGPHGVAPADVTAANAISAGWRSTCVLALTNSLIKNHSGPVSGAPWWADRNMGFQNADDLPIDFGGHEMNGVVSIHCDRPWGNVFENVQIVNAHNLKDAKTLVNVERSALATGYKMRQGFAGSSWGIMLNDSGGNVLRNCRVLNMLARTAASFAIHMAFGSRGNLVEDCQVMSCAGGAMWGFVADKGANGNTFKKCLASNITGGNAAGYVVRGHGNTFDECDATGILSIVNGSKADVDPLSDRNVDKELVSAGFLLDAEGTDEPEPSCRPLGHNSFNKCRSKFIQAQPESFIDRIRVIQEKKGESVPTTVAEMEAELLALGSPKSAEIVARLQETKVGGWIVMDQAPSELTDCSVSYVRGVSGASTAGIVGTVTGTPTVTDVDQLVAA